MPFTFKLSVRLALMEAWPVVAAVAFFSACEIRKAPVQGPTSPSVVQVVSSPDTVTLDPQQTRQFAAYGRTPSGDSVAVAVHWSSSGGTITAGGIYAAGTIAGDYEVRATVTDGSIYGSSRVRNRGPLTQIILMPATATVAAGGIRQFSSYGRRKNGDSVAVGVVYSATGGTISSAGLYTAGQTGGTFRVIATQTGGTLADSSAVTVAASAGGTILFRETFEDNQFASRGWYDNTSLATTATQHIAGSTRALEARFLAGTTTPTWGGAARRLFTPTPTLYVSYWVKYSANWVGSGRPYHPHEFLIMSDQDDDYSGLANGWLVSYIEHNYQNGGIPLLALQDNKAINTSYGPLPVDLSRITENRSTSGCNGVVELNVATSCFNMPPWYNGKTVAADQVWFRPSAGTPGYKGDWNHVEVYLRLNSVVGGIGLPDGVMQYWFNGTLVIDRKDILYRTGARPNIQFRQFAIAPYIGDGSPVDQTMWVDDLLIATARP